MAFNLGGSGAEMDQSISFTSVDDLRELISESFNAMSHDAHGAVDAETLLNILRQIEKDVDIYLKASSSFAHSSMLEILVFPKGELGRNMRFIGLATFYPEKLREYLEWFKVSPDDIGVVKVLSPDLDEVVIMKRFTFGQTSDNFMGEDRMEGRDEPVLVDELERRFQQRWDELGLK